MTDTTTDIDALLEYLGYLDDPCRPGFRIILTALVAERDELKQRVAELESQPPADRDRELRERLVCAIWPELLRIHSEYAKHPAVKGDPREQARRFALIEADEMLAAMRKGESHE
jgi:hypothetical protein